MTRALRYQSGPKWRFGSALAIAVLLHLSAIDDFFVEPAATPPPVHRRTTKLMPVVRSQSTTTPRSMSLSSAKVFALSAPRPQYPYEARRQKITGDGIALMTIDPGTGNVFLDNAAVTGFRR